MATDSTTAGYLLPIYEPQDDDDLADSLHDVIVGLTGLDDNLVRPRWQPEPPQRPEFSDNWAAFGMVNETRDSNAYQSVTGTDAEPTLTVERDSILTMLLSIYGPQASALQSRFSAGLMLDQNREMLFAQNMAVIEIQDAVNLPAKIQERWVKRIDVRILFRRRTTHIYPIRTLLSADVEINNEHYLTEVPISN